MAWARGKENNVSVFRPHRPACLLDLLACLPVRLVDVGLVTTISLQHLLKPAQGRTGGAVVAQVRALRLPRPAGLPAWLLPPFSLFLFSLSFFLAFFPCGPRPYSNDSDFFLFIQDFREISVWLNELGRGRVKSLYRWCWLLPSPPFPSPIVSGCERVNGGGPLPALFVSLTVFLVAPIQAPHQKVITSATCCRFKQHRAGSGPLTALARAGTKNQENAFCSRVSTSVAKQR